MLAIGTCRLCETGPLGLRTCGSCGQISIVCDECDALWISDELDAAPVLSEDPSLPCPNCGDSLINAPAHWATIQEVAACHWLGRAIDSKGWVLEEGKPLAPEDDQEHD